ncbi:MAG TPA: ABC transporter ATP-binding protein [Polyangia bacterium]|nr:ABC transporter ATP-binding protein [Polyangia bacterium]
MSVEISLQDVSLRIGQSEVIRGLSLTVAPGEVLALLGPSGSGKTTLLRLILGFVPPEAGSIRLGPDLVSADGRILRPPEERNLGIVFQDLALWPHLDVHGNLAFGLDARRVPAAERDRRIAEMLARVSLAGTERRYPGELSGGERQRVAIARALVLAPRALLVDEPLSNLDATLRRQLLELFRALLKERGMTAIFVTHDVREAALLSDRIALLERGRIVQSGTWNELRQKPGPLLAALLADLAWGAPS